jgi:predicted nucleic acid-binding protein
MTVAYIDTSACGKLLVQETHSDALVAFVDALDEEDSLVASQLLETELRRMATRHALPQQAVTEVLHGVSLVLPERDFFYRAGLLPGRHLRSLDALHLITAMDAEVDTFLTYDHRLMQSAEAIGLPSLSPS